MAQSPNAKNNHQEQEAVLMKRGFYKALIINLLFLAAIIALYILNRQYHFLDKLVASF